MGKKGWVAAIALFLLLCYLADGHTTDPTVPDTGCYVTAQDAATGGC